jgi:hypothetical protein
MDIGERYIRVCAKWHELFLALMPVLPTPQLAASRIDQKIESFSVGQLVGLLRGTRTLDCRIRQFHGCLLGFGGIWGYRNWGYMTDTPKDTPNATWLP